MSDNSIAAGLVGLLGSDAVYSDPPRHYLFDATDARRTRGHADAVVLPRNLEDVARAFSWCYERGVPIVPRGGGTGMAGGAVPHGGVVLGVERLNSVRSFDPLLWRLSVDAGITTARVRALAREHGLLFPPDPGAAEQSQLGGNVATNAGGPHAFKYGVTGRWTTGLEVVVAPGDVVTLGGPLPKDVASLDLKSLLVGSEGTLGVITGVWLRLLPAPEAAHVVAGFYADSRAGGAAVQNALATGVVPAAVEFLDRLTLDAARGTAPFTAAPDCAFALLVEADGETAEAARAAALLTEALEEGALAVETIRSPESAWRWRDRISGAVAARRGSKLNEDVTVPVEYLADAVEAVVEIGLQYGLESCSWGHAGDGNLHANFLVDPASESELARAEQAIGDVARIAAELGGSISGEHGVGLVKREHVLAHMPSVALARQREIKRALDPKGLLNPGKKV